MARLPYPENVIGVAAAVLGLCAVAAPIGPRRSPPPTPVKAPTITAAKESPLRDRAGFARALAQVEEGMPLAQVQKLLGEPDDVWKGEEVEAGSWWGERDQMAQVWAYGGNGHLTFPTLGRVGFDRTGRVVSVLSQAERRPRYLTTDAKGNLVAVPAPEEPLVGAGLPAELETRRILRLIDRLKRYDRSNDPLRVIQVVNALQPLGKAGALAVIDEYLRVSAPGGFDGGREGLFVVVRCLFEVPDPPGHFPPMGVGQAIPSGPRDLRQSPRFPVVLHRDIPFVSINGYMLGGLPEDIGTHLEPYRAWGKVRNRPLRPPDDPLAVIDELMKSPEWPDWGGGGDRGKSVAREQALRLVDSAYRIDEDAYDGRLKGRWGGRDLEWKSHLRNFAQLQVHWDPVRNYYVRGDDGFNLPHPEPYTYRRSWISQLPGGAVEVGLQRHHRKGVHFWLSNQGARPPMPRVRFYTGSTESRSDAELLIPEQGSLGSGFDAPEGSDIRVVLEVDGKRVAEKVMRP